MEKQPNCVDCLHFIFCSYKQIIKGFDSACSDFEDYEESLQESDFKNRLVCDE